MVNFGGGAGARGGVIGVLCSELAVSTDTTRGRAAISPTLTTPDNRQPTQKRFSFILRPTPRRRPILPFVLADHPIGPVGRVPSNFGERADPKRIWSPPTFMTGRHSFAGLDA